jgi:hypothetical protein
MATAERSTLQLDSLTSLHWIGIVLAAITGLVHLWLGISFLSDPTGPAFLAAAAGFFLGIVGILIGFRRRLLYLLGIPFTAGQIPIWYVVNAPDLSPIGIGDKVVQVVLIVVLILLYRRAG